MLAKQKILKKEYKLMIIELLKRFEPSRCLPALKNTKLAHILKVIVYFPEILIGALQFILFFWSYLSYQATKGIMSMGRWRYTSRN